MSKIDIIICGQSIGADIVGDLSGSLNYNDETDTVNASSAIRVRGDSAELIKTKLLKSPDVIPTPLDALVVLNCCDNFAVPFRVEKKNISTCENECDLEFKLTEKSTTSDKLNCLKNTLIWDRVSVDGSITSDGEDECKPSRYIKYCLEIKPKALQLWMMYASAIITLLFRIILVPLIAGIAVFNAIINAVNNLPGVNIPTVDFDNDSTTNIFDEVNLLVDNIERWATGCGYKHKAPFLYAYLKNISKLCGLTLKAPDFEPGGKLHNCMRLDAANVEGGTDVAETLNAYETNRPNLNGVQFLDSLKEIGLDWYVDGCLLCVGASSEINRPTEWFDIYDQNTDDYELCFSEDDETPCAYLIPEYCADALDQSGNDVRPCWVDTVINWNSPPTDAQSGACTLTLNYSAAQFRNDKCRSDVPVIDSSFINFFDFLFPSVTGCADVLLLSSGTSAKPKILCWDGVNEADNCARIQRRNDSASGLNCYNEMMHIKETGTNIYTCFLKDLNPRAIGIKNTNFELKIKSDCDILEQLNENKIGSTIGLLYCGEPRDGVIKTISIDLQTCDLTITGKI